ncbi:hypothetical protein KCTC32516_01209 [Polaribacter huanghezhanensis]|uniref:hypothetical protein n=1 Tax=Polaribacter huanghezhanensis TaxID=1354726 RepID=UPI00264950D8|nr:hypothetical protein [Polaribacter huanghezhanensis]WKD85862.1 hypothetical protein KCTC32516_01209 [Polaribacter huanghezhanensis]
MNFKIATALFASFFKTLGYLFLFMVFGLFLDSTYMSAIFPQTQHLATFVMLIGFAILYYRSASRLREQMIYAVIIGYIGEHLFSIGLGMYTYRLGNVPHYVPPGHAIVLITTMYFCKDAVVKTYRKLLEKIFTIFILVYATLFLIFAGDVFGFVMSLLVIFLLRNKPRERLFYLSMYIAVAFLEIIGTNYQCWFWPETAWNTIPFLKSANPPSGISLFYFLLDLGSLWLYKQRHKIAWARMKSIRKLTEN